MKGNLQIILKKVLGSILIPTEAPMKANGKIIKSMVKESIINSQINVVIQDSL